MYQIQRSAKPGVSASASTGTATITMRAPEVISDGIVLPIAWNMLELTKITPDATKLNATTWRYSSPTRTAAGSAVNTRTIPSAQSQTATASTSIAAAAIAAPVLNVSLTRAERRAPQSCP